MRRLAVDMEGDDIVRAQLGQRLFDRDQAAEQAHLQRSVAEAEMAAAASVGMRGHHHRPLSSPYHPSSGGAVGGIAASRGRR